jgi:hypothetical protein
MLDKLNQRAVQTYAAAITRTDDTTALWCAPTHNIKDELNQLMLSGLRENGHPTVKIWAHHTIAVTSESAAGAFGNDLSDTDADDDVADAKKVTPHGDVLPTRPAKRPQHAERPRLDDETLQRSLLGYRQTLDAASRNAKTFGGGIPVQAGVFEYATGGRYALDSNMIVKKGLGLVHYATGTGVGLVYPRAFFGIFADAPRSSGDASIGPAAPDRHDPVRQEVLRLPQRRV